MRLPTGLRKAIEAFRRGEFVALLDRADREAEADLLLPAEFATGERINTMITIARGLLTVAITEERLRELDIPLIEPRYTPLNAPRFAVPVDYLPAVTTGVSAYDRAATIRALARPDVKPEDFARPGHVFPLVGARGGLTQRQGHTEGALALAQLAGLRPVVAVCEIMAPDGHMARGADLRRWLSEHRIVATSVPQIMAALRAGFSPYPSGPRKD
ncbi:MAG: 3,4-dihydroxy-2-butanone-4-phosphate synthase [Armatimonadetes bacterium]|nr:3,4-dihydroxy-2-butanone-4-phosphate synthase [Armatimonadota bacterium]